MSNKDPKSSGLQRTANTIVYASLLSAAFLLAVGAVTLVRLVF